MSKFDIFDDRFWGIQNHQNWWFLTPIRWTDDGGGTPPQFDAFLGSIFMDPPNFVNFEKTLFFTNFQNVVRSIFSSKIRGLSAILDIKILNNFWNRKKRWKMRFCKCYWGVHVSDVNFCTFLQTLFFTIFKMW